jgi:hypothetical protein
MFIGRGGFPLWRIVASRFGRFNRKDGGGADPQIACGRQGLTLAGISLA